MGSTLCSGSIIMKKALIILSAFACFYASASDKVVIKDLTTSSNKTKYTLIIHTTPVEKPRRYKHRCSLGNTTCFESRSPATRALRRLK